MSARDYAYWDRDLQQYGYYTEDGTWHQCDKQNESIGF